MGTVAALIVVLQLALYTSLVNKVIDKFAVEYVDGSLEYSKVRVSFLKRFPKVIVEIDSLSITYPHDRYSRYDDADASKPLLLAGRGAERDTLAAFDRLYLTLNTSELLRNRIRVSQAELANFSAFLHQYQDGASNLNTLLFVTSETDTLPSKPLDLPWVSVGNLSIKNEPRIVYTNQKDTLFARIAFCHLNAGTDFKLSPGDLRLRRTSLDLDSLNIVGRTSRDTIALQMDYMALQEPEQGHFDLEFQGRSSFLTKAFGRMTVPFKFDGCVAFDRDSRPVMINVEHMDADIAYVPMHLDGSFGMAKDSTLIDARFRIEDCSVNKVLRNYADNFILMSRDIETDALLSVEIEAKGCLSDSSVPQVDACVNFPMATLRYAPMDITTRLAVDIDASMRPDRYVSADIHEFHASIPGASLDLDGDVKDALGRNPRFNVSAIANAQVRDLLRFVPESVGIADADGAARLELSARARKSDLTMMQFSRNQISGCLYTDSLRIRMPKDSLGAELFKTDIDITSGAEGIALHAVFDSLYFNQGVGLIARTRNMVSDIVLSKVETEDGPMPRVSVSSLNDNIFAKLGSNRVGLRSSEIAMAAQKIGASRRPVRRRVRLQNDSLGTIGGFNLPEYLQERDFAAKDIDIALDSSISRYLREWAPEIDIDAQMGFVATPLMPLRTRFDNLCLHYFPSDTLALDSLHVTSGSSDLLASATVTGLKRSLIRKGRIMADVDMHSEHLNLNELISALKQGTSDVGDVAPEDEEDESFVTDTLENAVADLDGMSLIVVPANVNAEIRVNADQIDYSDIAISPASAVLKVKERTVQLNNARVNTQFGEIGLDAFYSTKTKKDISAGLDMHLKDMSAHEIIHLLPSVDEMMPALKSFEGRLNCDLSATTQIDTNMNVIIPSLDGLMRITGKNLEVKDAGDLRKVTKLLMFKNKDIGHIDDLSVDAVVHDSRLEVFPFELGVDRYRLALRGMQGFDGSLYYHASILRSPFLVKFGVNIFGTLDNWKFALCRARYRDGSVPAYTTQLDSVQINIARSIRNIFNNGVDNVMRYSGSTFGRLSSSKSDIQGDDLSASELGQIEDLSLRMEMEEQEEQLQSEIDDVINATLVDTDSLLKAYSETAYDKKILRRMEKMKKALSKKK